MAIKIYGIHDIVLLGGVPLTLPQITQRTVNPKPNVIYNSGSGQLGPSFAAVAAIEPEVSFDTTALAVFFGAVSPLAGLGVGSGLTYTGVELYTEGKADLGARVGASLSNKFTSARAFLVPRSLSCEHGAEAKLSAFMLLLSADGSTAAIGQTNLVTAPAALATQKFTLGPVKINGVTLDSIMGVTIDFGIEIKANGQSGHTYSSFATISKREPKITVRTSDVVYAATFPPQGTALTTGATFYFRRFTTSGITYADNQAQHIAFTIPNNQGCAFPGPTSGSGSDDVSHEFEVHTLEGAAAQLAVALASTIT